MNANAKNAKTLMDGRGSLEKVNCPAPASPGNGMDKLLETSINDKHHSTRPHAWIMTMTTMPAPQAFTLIIETISFTQEKSSPPRHRTRNKPQNCVQRRGGVDGPPHV